MENKLSSCFKLKSYLFLLALQVLFAYCGKNSELDSPPNREKVFQAIDTLLSEMKMRMGRVLITTSDLCSICIVDDFLGDPEAQVETHGLSILNIDAEPHEIRKLNSIYSRHNVHYGLIPKSLKERPFYQILRSSKSLLVAARFGSDGKVELFDGDPLKGPVRGVAVWDFLLKN